MKRGSRGIAAGTLLGAAAGVITGMLLIAAAPPSEGGSADMMPVGSPAEMFLTIWNGSTILQGGIKAAFLTASGAVCGWIISVFICAPRARLPLCCLALFLMGGVWVYESLRPRLVLHIADQRDDRKPVPPPTPTLAVPSAVGGLAVPAPAASPADAIARASSHATSLFGEWWYPSGVASTRQSLSGDQGFPAFDIVATDDFSTVADYYSRIFPKAERTNMLFHAEGRRPGDGRPTSITITPEPDGIHIRFQSTQTSRQAQPLSSSLSAR